MLRRGSSAFAFAILLLGASSLDCRSPASYGHLGIDLDLAGLTPDQRRLVHSIAVTSAPDGESDAARAYHLSIDPSALDADARYHADYIPNPDRGTFLVSVELQDAKSNRLALEGRKVTLRAGETARAQFDFVAQVSANADCRAEGEVVTVDDGPGGATSFGLAWDGEHYLVVFTDRSVGHGDLKSVMLSPTGERASTPVAVNASPRVSTIPSIARTEHGFVVAWQEGDDTDVPVAVQLRHLDEVGAPKDNTRQIPTAAREARPMLVAFGADLALAWMDDRGTPDAPAPVALVDLVREDDLSLSPKGPVALAPQGGAAAGGDAFPALVAGDHSLAVSFVDGHSSVYTVDLGDDLAPRAPELVYQSSAVAQQLAVVSAGNRLFTLWEDLSGEIDLGRERIRGAYTSPAGSVLAGGYVHEIDTGSANWPRGAFNGEDSVAVVYYQYRGFGSQIYVTRTSLTGERIGDVDVELTEVAGEAKYPQIAFRGRDFDGHDHFGVGWIDAHTGVHRVYFEPIVCD